MPIDVDEKLRETIEKQTKSPEQAARINKMFETMGASMPSSLPNANVNMFELTVALCAAAQLIGKEGIAVDTTNIRTTSVVVAKKLFTEDGDFIVNEFKK
jgi:hypothetical protein